MARKTKAQKPKALNIHKMSPEHLQARLGQKAGRHADRRLKRQKTRAARKAAAMREW